MVATSSADAQSAAAPHTRDTQPKSGRTRWRIPGKTNGGVSLISRTVHRSSPTPGSVDRGCHEILSPLEVSGGSQRSCTSENGTPNACHARADGFRAQAEVLLARAEQLLAPRKLATVHELRDEIGSLQQRLVGTGAGGKIVTRTDTFLKVHGWLLPLQSLYGQEEMMPKRKPEVP
jgi:hypothetical protein